MKNLKLILLLTAVLLIVTETQAQSPFKGSCLSGNCKNGEGSYQIASYAKYTGSFKNGKPDGKAVIEGPGWTITGTFIGDLLTNYEERNTAAGLPMGGLQRSGSQKVVLFDYKHVQANFMTNNFYEMNGTYFQCVCSGTCTFYRGADWSITGSFNIANPNQVMGKAVVKWQGTDYQFNFPGSGEWVSVVKKDRILECLKAQNYSTGVLYDYSNPNGPVVKVTSGTATTTPAKTSNGDEGSSKSLVDRMNATEAADKIVREQALQTATQEDFCTTVQRVINELNNGFETWKGAEKPEYFAIGGKTWYAKYMIEGSAYATIYEDREKRLLSSAAGKTVNFNSWHGVFFNGKSEFSKILAMYQGYVSNMNDCTQSCCKFTSTTENIREPGSSGQTTTWKVSSVQPGSNAKYKDMKMTISFSMNTIGGDWIVDIWVE